tara:strand:- start:1798 stop:2079 length:282 start_codon:yes stop_codon:yes gene_type:complete
MTYTIIEYLIENKIYFHNYLMPSDIINLEKINSYTNSTIPKTYWLTILKHLLNAKDIIEYKNFYQVKLDNYHKITINKPINLKKMTHFLEIDK